ncbi:MAG: 5-carboxymethyl-2-hydroxymuconate isomerase [Gammaproteobacteria bacterium]|nr:5-carboxymethyl-2-hydroxymuconate isomerase [Gammaproteobacteria bacterium]MDH5800023.1 5-carboxymethyl-2-hydroxymuconate isomerase [Gammaproteobacteria bacterium]
MPHIIVEYAENALDPSQEKSVLKTIHTCVAQSGLFETSHIKTRAYCFRAFTHAGGTKPYIHVQARIKSGRNSENKKRLSNAIIAALQPMGLPVAVITVEIVDMDRESYGKFLNPA